MWKRKTKTNSWSKAEKNNGRNIQPFHLPARLPLGISLSASPAHPAVHSSSQPAYANHAKINLTNSKINPPKTTKANKTVVPARTRQKSALSLPPPMYPGELTEPPLVDRRRLVGFFGDGCDAALKTGIRLAHLLLLRLVELFVREALLERLDLAGWRVSLAGGGSWLLASPKLLEGGGKGRAGLPWWLIYYRGSITSVEKMVRLRSVGIEFYRRELGGLEVSLCIPEALTLLEARCIRAPPPDPD